MNLSSRSLKSELKQIILNTVNSHSGVAANKNISLLPCVVCLFGHVTSMAPFSSVWPIYIYIGPFTTTWGPFTSVIPPPVKELVGGLRQLCRRVQFVAWLFRRSNDMPVFVKTIHLFCPGIDQNYTD